MRIMNFFNSEPKYIAQIEQVLRTIDVSNPMELEQQLLTALTCACTGCTVQNVDNRYDLILEDNGRKIAIELMLLRQGNLIGNTRPGFYFWRRVKSLEDLLHEKQDISSALLIVFAIKGFYSANQGTDSIAEGDYKPHIVQPMFSTSFVVGGNYRIQWKNGMANNRYAIVEISR